jgi:hypothetical protein
LAIIITHGLPAFLGGRSRRLKIRRALQNNICQTRDCTHITTAVPLLFICTPVSFIELRSKPRFN